MPKVNRDMASSSQVALLDLKQHAPYSSQKLHQLYSYRFVRPIVHCTQMIMLFMTAAQDVSMHTVHDSSSSSVLLLLVVSYRIVSLFSHFSHQL